MDVDMVNPDSGAILSAQPRDPRALAEHICSDTFGTNAQVDIVAIPNSRHLMFRVLTDDNQYALKVICGEHAAWHAEMLARKLFADPAVPRIAFSGRHNADIDYAFIEWVEGESLAELLVEPSHPTVPIAFARAGDLLARIYSLGEPNDSHDMAQAPKAAGYFGRPDFFDYFEPHLRVISDRFGRELALQIQDALRPIATSVEAHLRPVIANGDLQPKNLIVSMLGNGLSLIDWEFISFSPIWADLSQLLRHSPSKQVEGELESGYSSVQPMPINWRAFARAYDLVRICTGLSQPPALGGLDIENWGRFVGELVWSVRDGGVHTTYESASFLR
jgi:Ser/Thr protein kinase RdoA (MazF antagonist)